VILHPPGITPGGEWTEKKVGRELGELPSPFLPPPFCLTVYASYSILFSLLLLLFEALLLSCSRAQ